MAVRGEMEPRRDSQYRTWIWILPTVRQDVGSGVEASRRGGRTQPFLHALSPAIFLMSGGMKYDT